MFTAHPSRELTRAFGEKPYQGADPKQAQLIFVGLDANYASNIQEQPIFKAILEYHLDGPSFWKKHGVHHPFLLPAYRGSGRKYHRNFSKIGLTPDHADRVSFVELLAIPTTGRSSLTPDDLDAGHLTYLHDVIFQGNPKNVFVSAAVTNLMKRTGRFPQLSEAADSISAILPLLYDRDGTSVYRHLHFSVYGKSEAKRAAEAMQINTIALQV